MSTGRAAQVALLGPGRRGAAPQLHTSARQAVPMVRLGAFAALTLYGTLRWSTLLSRGGQGKLLALLALALLLAGARAPLARRSRLLAALGTAVTLLAAFAVAGVPWAWVLHLRIAVTAGAIGEGLSALPQVLVPYAGVNEWVRLVIVLGAAVLLFDAALLLAFAPRPIEDLRAAGVALPLVALAAVPATLVRPQHPYLDGLVLFVLLAAFMWGERIRQHQWGGAVAMCALAGMGALIAGSALDPHEPWLDYRALAGSLAPRALDTFDWSQTYGPIDWPRRGHIVLEIKAARPEYWKAQNLDVFDGRAWTEGLVPGAQSTAPPARDAVARWSQTIEVTVRGMKTSDVVGAGLSAAPTSLSQPVVAGFSPGTWTTGSDLGPGDSYALKTYAPHPTPAQLRAAGDDYSSSASGYRMILLPPPPHTAGSSAVPPELVFSPFHSRTVVQTAVGVPPGAGPALLSTSPYAPASRLAQRLARSSATPYAFAIAIERYLGRGFTYSEDPPWRAAPLESFLFVDKRGYCQQFAGAMALLLRMGGVPARVAVGFTSGSLDPATHRWLVTDLDAHAWVEAWFARFGWVRFDPTPAAAPELGGHSPISSGQVIDATSSAVHATKRPETAAASATAARRAASAAGGDGPWAGLVGGALATIALLCGLLVLTRPLDSPALLAELERALARTGRPVSAGVTLAALERRIGGSPEASAYIRALRLARFAAATEPPTSTQRRALRRQLALSLGPVAKLRALWALPPRRRHSVGALPPRRLRLRSRAHDPRGG